jgi:hypothetical protein
MSENCCGGKSKPLGWGVYTDQYYINKANSKLRQDAIKRVAAKSSSDGVLIMEEINAMNRVGNEIIANNHQLRAEIYDLKSEVNRLTEIVRLVSEASTIEEAKTALHFPYPAKFNPIQE